MRNAPFSFTAVDVETTGLDSTAQIIEVGLAHFEDGVCTKTWQTLVRPTIALPPLITQLTGITADMLSQAPTWDEVEAQFLQEVEGRILVAHNHRFDAEKIAYALGKTLPNPWLDTYDVAKIFLPYLSSYKLVALADNLGVVDSEHHRALNDAIVCGNVLIALLARAKSLDAFTAHDIAALFPLDIVPTPMAEALHWVKENAVGVPEEKKTSTTTESTPDKPLLSFKNAPQFFAADGLLSKAMPSFEHRMEQERMLEHIQEALATSSHAIIEAGTGTGKSFAYLVPALLWSVEKKERIVVSTNTIALQDQLFHRDLPLLTKALGYPFRAVVSKGRANYLCLRRFYDWRERAEATFDEKVFAAALTLWVSETEDGDREVLNLNRFESIFWQNIAATADTCEGARCPFFDTCYYYTNRRAAEKSHLLIVNHALLLQDLRYEGVLPNYERVIIDEAHHLEEEATRQFTETVDFELLRKTLRNLIRKKGILDRLINLFDGLASSDLHERRQKLVASIEPVYQEIAPLIDYAAALPELEMIGDRRITEHTRYEPWWQNLATRLQSISLALAPILKEGEGLYHACDFEDVDDASPARELHFALDLLSDQSERLTRFLDGSDDSYVYWANTQRIGRSTNLYLHAARIDIMPILHEQLFAQKKSVVLTSATLAINQSLTYTAQNYLLAEDAYIGFICPSPFAYEEQSTLIIPNDRRDYSQMNEWQYTQQVIDDLTQLIPAVEGNMLVLFTSYAMLNKVYFALKEKRGLADYTILGHGQDGSRSGILKRLQSEKKVVVLGANSFWEGVDVKDSKLKAVVITKLPFAPPTMPIESAKSELLQSQGKNSFNHLSLPNAILRFRQGVGRLIRSSSDCGAIIVLDNRLLSKNYGKYFIRSIPKQPIIEACIPEITHTLKNRI